MFFRTKFQQSSLGCEKRPTSQRTSKAPLDNMVTNNRWECVSKPQEQAWLRFKPGETRAFLLTFQAKQRSVLEMALRFCDLSTMQERPVFEVWARWRVWWMEAGRIWVKITEKSWNVADRRCLQAKTENLRTTGIHKLTSVFGRLQTSWDKTS